MFLTRIFKGCFRNGSIGVVTLYNAIVSIIDIIFLILSIVLLSTDHVIIAVVGLILLVFSVIAIPCICCGMCYIWSLFHIQNNLKMARFMGICNFIMMIFTLILIIIYTDEEKEIENPGVMAFFMVINMLGLASVIFLCTMNCGFEEEPVVITEVPMRELPAPLVLNDCVYPDPCIDDKVEVQVVDCENTEQHIIYIENASAPPLSPSLEGCPTRR